MMYIHSHLFLFTTQKRMQMLLNAAELSLAIDFQKSFSVFCTKPKYFKKCEGFPHHQHVLGNTC